MNAGKLRHKITLQVLPDTQDSFGQQNEKWEDFKSVWSEIEPLSGKEYFTSETISSEVSHKIKIRYRPGITPDMRVKFGKRTFGIVSVINYKELNTVLQLMCKELI